MSLLSPAALTVQHWLSPAFPTGAFAYSHGLEQVIARGDVADPAGLELWLADVLRHGSGWQDAVLLSLGLREGADMAGLDALAQALQPSVERLQETQEQGAAFARIVGQTTGRTMPARALPVAVAEAAAPLGLPRAEVIAAYLQAMLTNLVTIAIRHMPLGQGAGHGVLARLLPLVAELATQAASARMEDFGNSCLGADLAAMEHETKDVRLFRT
jgi:urease accessory protein